MRKRIIGAAALVCVSGTASAQAWDADAGVIALEHACVGDLTPQQAQQMLRVPMKLSRVEVANEPYGRQAHRLTWLQRAFCVRPKRVQT